VSYLNAIVAQRRRDIIAEKRFVPIEALQEMVAERSGVRSLKAALQRDAPVIVAEIKRASPSAGSIDAACDPAAVAAAFERGGAAALSVLTEPRRFHGSFADLCNARAAVGLPVLCKDFVIDDFQIWKAAAFGADAVLLIAAVLSDARLRAFAYLAECLGLDAVVEVHTEEEAARAVHVSAGIIGINNRNLETFEVDTAVARHIRKGIPEDRLVIAESGYASAPQVKAAMESGIHAFLVGEALMRAGDRSRAVREMREVHAWSE
jgi:indole-3-glycerol phosphate synthase